MKLCVITINDYNNYGNRLQNFALETFAKNNISKIETVWWRTDKYLPRIEVNYSYKNIVKYILNWKNSRSYFNVEYIRRCIREYNIKKFTDRYINVRYDFEIKDNLNKGYDYFVVGSDQVWNPLFWTNVNEYSNAYFLKFAKSNQRIAYSASFGISELPAKYKELFRKGLEGIPHISVREEAGAKIVKELTGRDVPVLVDPTLLLSKEEWQSISMEPEWYKGEKYILTYFLGDVPRIIKQLAEKYGYKIYNLMDREDLNLYTSRVEEFLWLIEHAQLVCTDSFHACVFSIIFNTPFLVVNRKQADVADMTSRLDTLMKLFGYQDRFIDFNSTGVDYNKIMTMDFSRVVEIQDRERQRSLKFLKGAMNLE